MSAKGTARQVARRQCWDIVLTFSYLGFIKHLSRKGKDLYILQEQAGASRVGWTKRVEVFLVEQAWRIYIKRHSAGCVCLLIA